MGTILRNTLQVLAFAMACAPLGVLLWPLYGWMLPPTGANGEGVGAALVDLYRSAIVGALAGVFVGLYSLGLFQRAKRNAIHETSIACLRCGFTIPQTEPHCPNCGWTWGDGHGSEETENPR